MGRGFRRWGLLLVLLAALCLPRLGAERRVAPVSAAVAEPKYVALTFDDGPRRSTTEKLLNGLLERGAHATFFLIGEQVEGNEDLVKRMEAEGHQVGFHTYGHVKLTALSSADFSAQVDRGREAVAAVLGHDDLLLRPPYGLVDTGVRRRAGSPLILWSVDPEDWGDKSVERIVDHVVTHAGDGDIILLHDIYPSTVEAAGRIVDALHSRGYLFLTVDELARERRVELKEGEIYRSFHP